MGMDTGDTGSGGGEIAAKMRLALRAAMKAKDTVAIPALRSALAAIGNAEAVPSRDGGTHAVSQHVAGSTAGLAAAEAGRKPLTERQTAAIVGHEISDRLAAARQYEAAGHPGRAARLRHEAEAIQSALDAPLS